MHCFASRLVSLLFRTTREGLPTALGVLIFGSWAAGVPGCHQPDPPGCDSTPRGDDYWPHDEGTQWTFVEREMDLEDEVKVWTLADEGDGVFVLESEGQKPRRVEVTQEGGAFYWSRKLSFSPDDPETVITHAYFDPPRLRFDPSLTDTLEVESTEIVIAVADCPGAEDSAAAVELLDACPEASKTTVDYVDTWTVLEKSDVSVPAGDFDQLVCHTRSEKANDLDNGEKRYCWARGIGKVWEESGDKTEELQEVCFP